MKRILAHFVVGSIALTSISSLAYASVSQVFVSNRDDNPATVSLIRCNTSGNQIQCVEKERKAVPLASAISSNQYFETSWPANQHPGHPAWWWTGLSGEVVGLKAKASLAPLQNEQNVVLVDTYDVPDRPNTGANFIGVAPDGRTAWNSAREVDLIQEIDTDPDSPTFGTILTTIPVPDLDPSSGPTASRGAVRPCDATITPDGRYFLEPDLAGESLTIVDTQLKEIVSQTVLQPADPGISPKVLPFMATTNGQIVLVENLEGLNTYDIFDISDPANPAQLKKLTQLDGLGVNAQTSEFTPDGKYAYLIMNGAVMDGDEVPGQEGRIDVLNLSTLTLLDPIVLPENCGPHTGDFSRDGRYFFVNCSRADSVAVVENASRLVVLEMAVGDNPRGVIVR